VFTLSWLSARMPVHKSLRQFSHYTTHCHCSVAVSAGVGMWADEFEISDIWWDYSPSSAFTSIFKADKGSPTLYTSTGVILHTKQSTIKQWQATISCLQGPQSPSQPQYINALWSVPNYTASWQNSWNWIWNFSTASLMPSSLLTVSWAHTSAQRCHC